MKTLQECVEANVKNILRKPTYWITINSHPKAPYTKADVFHAVCTVFDLSNTRYKKGRSCQIVVFSDK